MANFDFDKRQIKNIVFDVGSILVGYRWLDMFADHGIDAETAHIVGRGFFDSPYWNKYDAGLITTSELVDRFCETRPEYEAEARWFIDNAIQMRVLRPRVYEEVKKLKDNGYKLYILSNYSHDLFELHTSDLPFREWMDGEMVSYKVNVTKPDPKIYELTRDEFSIVPEESLFFDDRLENVEGAKVVGFNAIHVEDGDEEFLLDCLYELNNI